MNSFGKFLFPILLLAMCCRILAFSFCGPGQYTLFPSQGAQVTQAVDAGSPLGLASPALASVKHSHHRRLGERSLRHFVALTTLPPIEPHFHQSKFPAAAQRHLAALDLDTASRPPNC